MIPETYRNIYLPIKFFLNSYRAFLEGKYGISKIQSLLDEDKLSLDYWKILWVGTCTTLRSSIDLFQVDVKSCINEKIKNSIQSEWRYIKDNKKENSIFWDFLRRERDNIIHEYKWDAYLSYLDTEGNAQEYHQTILGEPIAREHLSLLMKYGPYEGRNSLELLKESAAWIEERIYCAITRAGYSPDEERNIVTFETRPSPEKLAEVTIIS
ncbi:hypothetical protein [Oleispirillum naphthae]|uniref:hypothetical protein n=1 Tax=Oleispirillum naphthae TaxID=2838853 RepID=UPI0030824367